MSNAAQARAANHLDESTGKGVDARRCPNAAVRRRRPGGKLHDPTIHAIPQTVMAGLGPGHPRL
ncbi:MAG: hypothetical protein NUV50_11605 [Rhodospirillales bacterium]|nr:hypothetical protein [Rhodospirillales bacterium]